MPDPGVAAPTREQVFAWMAETGHGQADAARTWGIHPERLKTWVRRHGDPRPRRDPDPKPAAVTPSAPTPLARVDLEPPHEREPEPAGSPPQAARAAATATPPRPLVPKPNAAELLSPDDRAELVALARSIRRRCKRLDELAHQELDGERPNTKRLDELARASRASAAELQTLLDAHPGLMALVETDSSMAGSEAAEQVEAFLGRL